MRQLPQGIPLFTTHHLLQKTLPPARMAGGGVPLAYRAGRRSVSRGRQTATVSRRCPVAADTPSDDGSREVVVAPAAAAVANAIE